jgi:formylmethanofuran dehydrogenase subunit A
MTPLRIAGGTVYDPANGVNGDVRDVCIDDGCIVADVPASAPRLDAGGLVVMPGGVDMHCHVASGAVNVARRLLPEDHARDVAAAPALDDVTAPPRSGVGGTVPSTFTTGYRYAGLGYTTVFDAAVAPLMARSAHGQLDDTPIVDGGFFALIGNDDYLLRLIDTGDRERAREYAAWLLGATGAYALKLVNPGGVELWKRGSREGTDLDQALGGSRVTPRAIMETLTDAADALGLPHAAHIHCNNLGLPGNAATTLATMAALDGRRAHLTHLQFHSYGRTA